LNVPSESLSVTVLGRLLLLVAVALRHMSEQFLNGTSAQYWLCSAILLRFGLPHLGLCFRGNLELTFIINI